MSLSLIPLALVPNTTTSQVDTHIVMSKDELEKIGRRKKTVEKNEAYTITPDSLKDKGNQTNINALKNKLNETIGAIPESNIIEFWTNKTLSIDVEWKFYDLSIVWDSTERFLCIEHNWVKMLITHGKPVMTWGLFERFLKEARLSVKDPEMKRIFDNGQTIHHINSMTYRYNEQINTTLLTIKADYYNEEKDSTIIIEPNIPLAIIKRVFNPKFFTWEIRGEKIINFPIWDLEKEAIIKGLIETDNELSKTKEELIKEWYWWNRLTTKLREIEKKKEELYDKYLENFWHVKGIDITYKRYYD